MQRFRLLLLTAALGVASAAQAQAPTSAAAPSLEERRLHEDWAYLARFKAEDAALIARGERPDVVFLGDSITQGWSDKAPAMFTPGRVNRGVSGQTTPQMLVRFRQDVVALKPRAVHILAGINDIAGNTGPMDLETTEADLASMTELAQAHGIRVILASVTPAADFPWRPGLHPSEKIRALNAWIRDYARRAGAVYADYTAVLDDGRGGMRSGLAYDQVHPTAEGYAAMAPVTEAALAKALSRPAPVRACVAPDAR